MKKYIFRLTISAFLLSSIYLNSQEFTVTSNLENLKIEVGEIFEPVTNILDKDGNKVECPNIIYYNKNGALNWDEGISVNRRRGTIKGEVPGQHKIIALCVGLSEGRVSRDFDVTVNYAKPKELQVNLSRETVYTGTYVPLQYKVVDAYGFTRFDADIQISSDNDLVEIDVLNNVKAVKPGNAKLKVELDGVSTSLSFKIKETPISKLSINADLDVARTGDVVKFTTTAYDSKGNEVTDAPLNYSFSGDSFDKSTTAAGLIKDDGRFVAETAGKYLITVTAGEKSISKPLVVYDRGIQREVVTVGAGTVQDKHTSDFWVFEGQDGNDYAVSGTWGADGTTYFWDVTDPANLKKIDSVQVDARTVNDVKVSADGKISIISREGASNRRNGIVILDTTNPYDVKTLSEYTTNLTGGVHNLFIYEDHVYALSNGERFYVINIEDPTNPYEVGMFEIGEKGQAIHDVWIEDGIAYSSNWKHGVYMIDVGNGVAGGSPSNPVAMANYSYESGAHHATFPFKSKSTDKFYTILGDEIFPQGIDVYTTNETAGFLLLYLLAYHQNCQPNCL